MARRSSGSMDKLVMLSTVLESLLCPSPPSEKNPDIILIKPATQPPIKAYTQPSILLKWKVISI
ncbi:hypothetical protein YC2023_048933 [Brassica napus]